ncbi:sensor histidine kinase [Phytomonospora sp. NPDC050363]|uniref:sensor histidine kinase n=1 Tax=Phytomonospora sp. NPDC050363 TaxID=3155642 RepID=UPI00340DEA01
MPILSSPALRALMARPSVQDAGAAAALFTATFLMTGPGGMIPREQPWEPALRAHLDLWWAGTALALLAVALRRRWPLSMLALCGVAVGLHMELGAIGTPVDLAVPILVATVAARHRRKVSVLVLIAFIMAATLWSARLTDGREGGGISEIIQNQTTIGPAVPRPPVMSDVRIVHHEDMYGLPAAWGGLPVLGSVLIAAWAFGSRTQARRAYLVELTARARDLERERDQRAALAVAAERGRIGRELHDVVAHGLSVMVVQAQGGQAAIDNRPADTKAALAAIVETGRRALADMRRALAAVGSVDAIREPSPGLAQLEQLAARVGAAGQPVEVHVEGRPVPLPTAVDLAAYRIAQEALTNTVKHAGPGARAVLTVVYGDAEVRVEVTDNGRAAPVPDGSGSGLRGMRERAELLGGAFRAGPAPGGGFTVTAALPIDRRTA